MAVKSRHGTAAMPAHLRIGRSGKSKQANACRCNNQRLDKFHRLLLNLISK